MNSRDSELFKSMMKASLYMSVFAEMADSQRVTEMFEGCKVSRKELEHHPSISTDVRDKDMLLLHIDIALDAGDSELFMHLTNETNAERLARITKYVNMGRWTWM